MSTKSWAVLTILFTTLLTSSAQILWKIGAPRLSFNLAAILTNYHFIGGVLLYIVGGVLLIISLRGGELSVLYPLIATSYIWVSFLSVKFLGENISFLRILGIASIIAGISFIGYGSKWDNAKSEKSRRDGFLQSK